jgi:galactose oxidase
MFCPGTSHLRDGRLLIAGGLSDTATTFYNPYNDTWSPGPPMNIGRGYQSQFTLNDGRAFTLGGSWSGGVGGKVAELYNPATNTWTTRPGIYADGTVVTKDGETLYRRDNHMWFYESTNGLILHPGPSQNMHWFNISGNGSVQLIGYDKSVLSFARSRA